MIPSRPLLLVLFKLDMQLTAVIVLLCSLFISDVLAFRSRGFVRYCETSPTMNLLGPIAELSVALSLKGNAGASMYAMHNSLSVAVVETKQGLYRDYSVDKVDDTALDEIRTNYKTAEQTEENKTKYWALLGVLLAGSFAIPMVQYYWYVADEDD